MDHADVEIEFSPLSREVTRDGVTVRVDIFRIKGARDGWSLEVIDREMGSTVWNKNFSSDQDADREFYRTLERDGIRTFLNGPAEHH